MQGLGPKLVPEYEPCQKRKQKSIPQDCITSSKGKGTDLPCKGMKMQLVDFPKANQRQTSEKLIFT